MDTTTIRETEATLVGLRKGQSRRFGDVTVKCSMANGNPTLARVDLLAGEGDYETCVTMSAREAATILTLASR